MVRTISTGKETGNVSKKLLALLLCVLLMLSMAGCLEKSETEEAPKSADAVPEATAIDDSLPAFTLGDIVVTVGEVRSSYDTVVEYMGYYGMAAPSTDEDIQQYRDMIIEDLLSAKVLPWKAQQMGITLTEAKRSEVAQEVEELIAEYASDYLEEAETALGADAGAAEIALKARELLAQDVEDYFGYSFEQWLSEVTASYEESALSELLQEKFSETVTITEDEARAWFQKALDEQKKTFAEDYTAYKTQLDSYLMGETDTLPLYTPEGFARMQVITFDVDAQDSAAYAANELEMADLEAEYGKLLLRGENEDRQTEIVARYNELRETNATLLQKDRDKAEKAREDALGGMDFTELFKTYSNMDGSMSYFGYAEGEPRRDGAVVFYTLERDTAWPEQIWTAAKDMEEGEISELLQVGDSFYLIKRLADLPAAEVAFEDNAAAYTAAALAEKQATEWDAVQEDWVSEARNAAVFYEENYANVGKQ